MNKKMCLWWFSGKWLGGHFARNTVIYVMKSKENAALSQSTKIHTHRHTHTHTHTLTMTNGCNISRMKYSIVGYQLKPGSTAPANTYKLLQTVSRNRSSPWWNNSCRISGLRTSVRKERKKKKKTWKLLNPLLQIFCWISRVVLCF